MAHVLGGPDHWLPFVVMGRAQRWSWRKLLLLTLAGGIGHVGSSIVIGSAGIGLGVVLEHINAIEEFRDGIAGWLLVLFGAAYALWGIREAKGEHASSKAEPVTAWAVVLLLVLGPCKPLVPLMFAAVRHGWGAVWGVCSLFSLVTVVAMLIMVSVAYGGLLLLPFPAEKLEKWGHIVAGGVIAATGLAVMLLEI